MSLTLSCGSICVLDGQVEEEITLKETRFDTEVTDVLLAAATASLRRYMVDRAALRSGPLLAWVPMSVGT